MQVNSAKRIQLDIDFEVQRALHDVVAAANPLVALNVFRDNLDVLNEWQVLFADENDYGTFKLRHQRFSKKGLVATIFRGKSLWVLDTEFAVTRKRMGFLIGTGTFVDSNAASYIRSLAYSENTSTNLLDIGRAFNTGFTFEELGRLNPFLYLWEAQRNWTERTVKSCTQTVAAIHALSLSATPMDENWSSAYRTHYREQAETFAGSLLAEFQSQLDNGLGEAIAEQVDFLEAMLIRTKIIEITSRKSAEHKVNELIEFMHDELSTMMTRELVVCADILRHEGKSNLSKKLNSLGDRPDPLGVIRNCAWDLYLPRAMDNLTNAGTDLRMDFYVPNLITFDADVADILRLTELRGIALHRPSHGALPFLNEDMMLWVESRVGKKRMPELESVFEKGSIEERDKRRTAERIREITAEDRIRLLTHLSSKKA